MPLRLFSTARRPAHLGPYPLERLARTDAAPDLAAAPPFAPLAFARPDRPESLVNAMAGHQAMLDAIRDGLVNRAQAEIPADLTERANHLKGFAYFCDASMAGTGALPAGAILSAPAVNPGVERLRKDLQTRQTKTLAAGIDMIMADLKESMEAPPSGIDGHTHALVLLYEHHRDPRADEPGADWILDAQAERACLRAAETAVVIANYIRLLGWDAKAHSGAASDVDLNRLALAAGLATAQDGALHAPFLGDRFGLAAITMALPVAPDRPLAEDAARAERSLGWALGRGTVKGALNRDPYAGRNYVDGALPFERLTRVDTPTTYMDEPRIPRVPKRTDMFARAQFGDMGKPVQEGATGGKYARKSAPSMGQRRALGAFVLLQDGAPGAGPRPTDARANAEALKAASYFLGADAAGLSRCPDWAWYSHDAAGEAITPPHDQALSLIIDQGYETMEGASGDDWISVAQSMRAYLRFSLLGGVIAQQIRNLGYSAKAHSVMDGDVLQPPLLLLSGLGEVSRIGEVILNPYLGPRLKSGAVTTDMPVAHDKPIDFGLQRFCEACNKCARECPSGAITAGPKLMFNGYETWKSDSQRCATYRITTEGGAMCGRCMKTCPWNLEGIFAEAPFRWAAMNIPSAAPALARLDDAVGNGGLNPVKKWWWDIELAENGAYRPARAPVNARDLQPKLKIDPAEQTLAVYPAPLAPHPWPYPFPMDREAGIAAYEAMIPAEEYRRRIAEGDESMVHRYTLPGGNPVLRVVVAAVERPTPDTALYTLRDPDGADLPEWAAGAHVDVVVAPEFLRQYSLAGDPADRSCYKIGVLREDAGRGGSALMHRIFTPGRRIFISRPINHFPLHEDAPKSFLMGGGIGVTPMLAMAHRLHALGRDFSLHYSVRSRADAAYAAEIAAAPWADRAHLHVSAEGTRADFAALFAGAPEGAHVYACGSDRHMDAAMAAADAAGIPEDARHVEYFALPEEPEYENHPFTLRLASGQEVPVDAETSAADALIAAGIAVDLKCSDGLCGVCACGVRAGAVEHRDFVLSKARREKEMILCRSRAAEPGGVLEIDL
ncbi:reductive dehalogenase [Rhodovulum sp. DZ06]|uniref:reductive dehalogenase n=1 Tax=Rhodovulum sp. DZ06 TaxID=3425126 RepID=UPI003D3379DA